MLKVAGGVSTGGGSGTVTLINTGTGLSGGPISTTGTIAISNTTVTAAAYGSANTVATFTVNAQGQLTAAGNSAINIAVANVSGAVSNTTTVSAGGLLTGGGNLASNVTITLNNVPIANVTGGVANTIYVLAGTGLSGGGNLASNVTLTLANTAVAAGSYGTANTVSQITVDAQGRITSAANVAISVSAGNITGLGTMATQNANAVVITGGTTDNVTQTNVTISSGNATLNNVTAGNVNITYRGTSSNTGALNVGGAMSNPDIGVISSFVGNASTYSYIAIQNTNNSTTSYSSVSAINDGFTAYSDMGVNSSNYSFSASGFPNNAVSNPNASFFVGYNGNVAIATWNANSVHFLANASASTSSAMVINGNNSVTINSLGQATSATATFATSSLPLVPAGYLQFTLANSTVVKVPYYAN